MAGVRTLHKLDPVQFSTPLLAARFRISPEAVRRILKSQWEPSRDEKDRIVKKERRRREEGAGKRMERMREEREMAEEGLQKRDGGEVGGMEKWKRREEDGLTFV